MPLVIAHRGEPRGCVENTLSAVLRAVALGADLVEVDVRRTLDGVPVLHHDASLRRVHGRRERIALHTAGHLRTHAPDLPTLAEALDAVRGSGVPLLLDVRSAPAARSALDVVRQAAGGGPLPAWFCGPPRAVLPLRHAAPEATLMLSWRRVTPPREGFLARIRPEYFNPWHRLVDEALVGRWHARGVAVSTWTVDDARRRSQVRDWGVDAVITNLVAAGVAERDRLEAVPAA